MFAIYKKELRQYFNSMIGFTFLAFFLAIIGIYTWAYNFAGGLGNFEITLGSISFLFVLLIPILTMRIVAEENRQKTNQLLYTAPVSVTKIILGKFLAVQTLFLIGIAVICLYPLIISLYGSGVRLSMAYSSMIGFFLLGSAGIAIGLFISALTESQAIAAVVTFIVLLLTFLMEHISGMLPTDALTQCILVAILWLAAAAFCYHMVPGLKLSVAVLLLGEAAIWVIYFVKSSLYEGLVSNVLNIMAISTRFDDFSLGILRYDAIIYYISVILLFIFLTIQMIRSQQYKSGAYSTILVVLVIAITVGVNLVFTKLDLTTDLSMGSCFTLSKDTKEVAKGLNQDITIYYMVQSGDEESYIDNVLKQYNKLSGHVSVEKVDPVVNPGFADSQGVDEEVMSNDVIVLNNETKAVKYISGTEMYYSEQDYTTGSYNYYLDVEGRITSAIQNVAAKERTKLYIMTKHSEQPLGSVLTEALEKMNIETEELELAIKDAVPEDCNILLLNGPAADLTDGERDMLLDYLKNGGAAMINIGYTTEEMPNLKAVLEDYGIVLDEGMICEGAGNYMSFLNNIVPSVTGKGDILNDLAGYIMFPDAAGLTRREDDSLREGLTITDLLDTSDSSYLKKDPSDGDGSKEDGDEDGPFAVGMSVTEQLDDDKETKLIVYSTSMAFVESLTATSQIENANVFKESVSSLTATGVKEISIDKKDLSYSYISVSPAMQLFWAATVIIVIPAGLLITGFIIWYSRRRSYLKKKWQNRLHPVSLENLSGKVTEVLLENNSGKITEVSLENNSSKVTEVRLTRKRIRQICTVSALCALLIVVGTGSFFAAQYKESKQENGQKEIEVYTFQKDKICKIHYTNETADIALVKEQDVWRLEEDSSFPVEQSVVKTMAEAAASVKAERLAKENCEDLAEYGLEQPKLTLVLEDTNGNKKEVAYGMEVPAAGGCYAHADDSKTIYVVPSDVISEFEYTKNQLMEVPALPEIDEDNMISYSVKQQGKNQPADKNDLEDIAYNLSELNITEGVSYQASEKELKQYGLKKPEFVITVEYQTDGDTESKSLQISAGALDDTEENYFVSIKGEPGIYLMPADIMNELRDWK